MTTLPPYPGPSDLEREALTEQARQAALYDSPQVQRNKVLFTLIMFIFLLGLWLCGLLAGYRLAGGWGLVIFAILWFVLSIITMAWAIRDAPEIK